MNLLPTKAVRDNLVAAPFDPDRNGAGSKTAARVASRDRYIDVLRVLALVSLVTYRHFGWQWLPVALPSMGILFALAGCLAADSLTRAGGDYWTVLAKRLRRLLPPVWVYGAVIVSVMIAHGWTATQQEGGDPLHHWRLMFFWALPVATPPGSDWGHDFVQPLWYVSTYLWLLLLSPALLFLFRRWPRRVIVVPLAVVAASAFGIIDLTTGRGSEILLGMAIYGACWMVGFAYRDGRVASIRSWLVVAVSVALLATGLAWAISHETSAGWAVINTPLAAALYSLGAVLLLVRFPPSLAWLGRRPVVDKTVTMISSRALTIYLWHSLAIFLAVPLLDSSRLTAALDRDTPAGGVARYATAWILTIAATFLFGWVEDIAARRPPRFIPWPRRSGGTDLVPGSAGARRLAWLPARDRPFVLACTLVAAAAAITGALLWPWNHDDHRSHAQSMGNAVARYPGPAAEPSPPATPDPINGQPPPPSGGRPAESPPPRPGSPQRSGAPAPTRPGAQPSGPPGGTAGQRTSLAPGAPASPAPTSAGGAPQTSSAGTPSSAPTSGASAAPTAAAPSTPAPTPTPAPTSTPAPTPTPAPTSTPAPTPTPTSTRSATPPVNTPGRGQRPARGGG